MHPIIVLMGLICVAGILGVSGWHKLRNPLYYQVIIQNYVKLGDTQASLINRILGVSELALATMLLIAPLAQYAAIASSLLLFAYLLLLGLQLIRGKADMDCGCSGPAAEGQKISSWLLFRNAALIALVSTAIFYPVTYGVGLQSWMVGILSGSFLLAIYFLTEQLMNNAQKLQKLRVSL